LIDSAVRDATVVRADPIAQLFGDAERDDRPDTWNRSARPVDTRQWHPYGTNE
jgi:hypothetical protein